MAKDSTEAARLYEEAARICAEIGDEVGAVTRRENARDFWVKAGIEAPRIPIVDSTEFNY